MKIKKPKKKTRKSMLNKLDDLCREITRLTYDNKCYRCDKTVSGYDSQPSHIIPKGRGANWRRFDLLNIKLLCLHCHQWWHLNPTESGKWFNKKEPYRMKYLNERYGGGKPAKILDLEMDKLIIEYQEKLKNLKPEE